MQPDRPLLTIAIPTYNRAAYLQQLLSGLCEQVISHPEVELLISDNASTDATPSAVSLFESQGLRLQYVRNEINIGADANFLQCFEQARGKYLWVVGDDDVIVPGSIDKVLPLLQASDYAFVYLVPYPFRDDIMAGRQHDRFGRFAQRVPNGSAFIRIVGPMLTFISAIIVNKERYERLQAPNLSTFVGTNLIQLGWCLPLLASGGESLIFWDRILAARVGNSGGYGIGRVFAENLNALMATILQDREDLKEIVTNCNLRDWFPTTIIQNRYSRAGDLEEEDLHVLMKGLYRLNWRYWVYVFPVIGLPRSFARGWWTATQLLNRGERVLRLMFSYPHQRRSLIPRAHASIAHESR
jgi:glycosyltransferase involved in cell wall biosynthesis